MVAMLSYDQCHDGPCFAMTECQQYVTSQDTCLSDACHQPLVPQVTTMMTATINREFSWMVAAHRLLARFDAFLVSGLLSSLTTVTEDEENKAKTRVNTLSDDDHDAKPPSRRANEAGPSNPSNSNGPAKRARRRNNRRGGGGGGRGGGGRGAGPKQDQAAAHATGK